MKNCKEREGFTSVARKSRPKLQATIKEPNILKKNSEKTLITAKT